LLSPWKRHLMLFPTLEPSSLPIAVAQPGKRHVNRTASVLECMTDTEHSTTSGSNEEDPFLYLQHLIDNVFREWIGWKGVISLVTMSDYTFVVWSKYSGMLVATDCNRIVASRNKLHRRKAKKGLHFSFVLNCYILAVTFNDTVIKIVI